MDYPKPIMRKSELEKMGFPSVYLTRAYLSKGQVFARKINPNKNNSPIFYDTKEFEKWRLANK